ncbi:MAG TPA: translation initiation factor IF-2 [Nitrososphaeraceae archaeon]|nr:translation initiation factor IF-2 [Nitrososphaeraceae archaeon]
MALRHPVVVVLGHVDSGKTSLLDKVRGTAVQAREAGGITQHIGASFFPIDTIKSVTGDLFNKISTTDSQIPGILVIDTPGHEVFATLRVRGGSAADIAIIVVDANKGFEAQTEESIGILKKRKVPFVIALNKVDTVSGWRNDVGGDSISRAVSKQDKSVQTALDEMIYNVVGSLSISGYNSEAFWRIKNFTKEVAIVPVSARTGVGIPELLAVLIGLTQQYLSRKLERHEEEGRGIVLEINEEVGLGPAANVILFDGTLRQGCSVIVAKRNSAVVARVKAILLPRPLDEMRDPRDKFRHVSEVISAAGVKITSPDLAGVMAGSPLFVLNQREDETRLRAIVEAEIKNTFVNKDINGVIMKCDTIGSIEAISDLLAKQKVPIRIADVGHVTKRDVIEASAVREKDRYLGVVLAFNVRVLEDALREAQERQVMIFDEKIIYNLVRSYTDWTAYQKDHQDVIIFNEIPPVCKFQFLKNFVFRRNDPAVFGAEILVGKLRQKIPVINDQGKKIGVIHQIQQSGKTIEEATLGMQVAVSIRGPTIGRQISEGEIFYTDLNSRQAKLLNERFAQRLTEDELEVLNYIVDTKRKVDELFGYV